MQYEFHRQPSKPECKIFERCWVRIKYANSGKCAPGESYFPKKKVLGLIIDFQQKASVIAVKTCLWSIYRVPFTLSEHKALVCPFC